MTGLNWARHNKVCAMTASWPLRCPRLPLTEEQLKREAISAQSAALYQQWLHGPRPPLSIRRRQKLSQGRSKKKVTLPTLRFLEESQ